jgi:hypothetical protein
MLRRFMVAGWLMVVSDELGIYTDFTEGQQRAQSEDFWLITS